MTSHLFNEHILRMHQQFAMENIHKSDFLIEHAACDIIENLDLLDMHPKRILEIAPRAGHLTKKVKEKYGQQSCYQKSKSYNLVTSQPFDIILSSMNFHWSNDLLDDLQRMHQNLTPAGRVVMNFVGSGSLENLKKYLLECELKANFGHSPHVIPLLKEEKVQGLFQQAGFKFVVIGVEKIELEYTSPITLMRDLKNMGENNALTSGIGILPRNVFEWNSGELFYDTINLITVVAGR